MINMYDRWMRRILGSEGVEASKPNGMGFGK